MITPQDLGLPSKFQSFHPGQEKAIIELSTSERRCSVLIAPTGSGKSAINISAAILAQPGRSLYLTATKGLQSQLQPDFHSIGLRNINGHSAYPCSSGSGSWADDSDFECFDPDNCGRARDLAACRLSTINSTNYANWVTIGKSETPDLLGYYDQIICDEAHNLHNKLTDFMTIEIRPDQIKSLISLRTPDKSESEIRLWLSWASEAIGACRSKYSDLRDKQKRQSKSKELARQMSKIKRLGQDLRRFLDGQSDTEWLAIRGKDPRNPTATNLTPVWCKAFAEKYIFRGASRIILSSATITESDADILGIPAADRDIVEVDSIFPVSRRPFIYCPVVKVDSRMSEYDLVMLSRAVDEIVSARPDQKGVGFTSSFDYAKRIWEHSRLPKDVLLINKPSNTAEIVKAFMESEPPSFLLSPSIDEGYDFKGKLAEYGILTKIPFLSARDVLIRARLKTDKDYIDREAARTIHQMAGRGMRSATDRFQCMILDKNWGWWKKKSEKFFAKHFRLAWRVSNHGELPPPMVEPTSYR